MICGFILDAILPFDGPLLKSFLDAGWGLDFSGVFGFSAVDLPCTECGWSRCK